jgi:hypothetical protein
MAILTNCSDFEDRIRVQRELATIKAYKEIAKKKKQQNKSKKLTGDFDLTKPNIIKVKKQYSNKGTVLLGERLDNKPWRFGHSPNQIHALTVISVEGGGIYELPTQKIYAFIHEKSPNWIYAKYGIFTTKAFQIDIHDLVDYCGKEMTYSV